MDWIKAAHPSTPVVRPDPPAPMRPRDIVAGVRYDQTANGTFIAFWNGKELDVLERDTRAIKIARELLLQAGPDGSLAIAAADVISISDLEASEIMICKDMEEVGFLKDPQHFYNPAAMQHVYRWKVSELGTRWANKTSGMYHVSAPAGVIQATPVPSIEVAAIPAPPKRARRPRKRKSKRGGFGKTYSLRKSPMI